MPFFPTGSFERIEEEGDVATAFTLARMLSNTPVSRGGPTSLVIYDIHALQVPFFLPILLFMSLFYIYSLSISRGVSLQYLRLIGVFRLMTS